MNKIGSSFSLKIIRGEDFPAYSNQIHAMRRIAFKESHVVDKIQDEHKCALHALLIKDEKLVANTRMFLQTRNYYDSNNLCFFSGKQYLIEGFCSSEKGQGFGAILLEKLSKFLPKMHTDPVAIMAEVVPNEKLRNYYLSQGFKHLRGYQFYKILSCFTLLAWVLPKDFLKKP